MREIFKGYRLGLLIGIFNMLACAGVTYKYYGLELPAECYDQGHLLGSQGSGGWPDLPFSQCKPDDVTKGKCVVQLTSDFFSKDRDLKECQVALKQCQQGPQPHEPL